MYLRPDGKSGGHGIGWSEITPYRFQTYEGWEEIPVSIADPEGTEIDAKFASESDGELKIVLAPILRFANIPEEVITICSAATLSRNVGPSQIRRSRIYSLCEISSLDSAQSS